MPQDLLFVGKKDFINIFIHCRQVNLNYFISLLIYRIDDTYYDNFGIFYNNTLSYLFTNPERDVVKHNIDNPKDVPRHIPNTRIPNQHIPNKEIANQHTGSVITGVHVGHYFWIFGGKTWHNLASPLDDYKVQIKSSLWSLNKEAWINGPEIPEGLIKDYPCATALNDTFAIIININSYWDIIPARVYDFSKGGWHSMANPPMQIPDERDPCTCATMYEKTYRQ